MLLGSFGIGGCFGFGSFLLGNLLFCRFVGHSWNDPNLEFAFDLLTQMNLDRVESQFLEWTFETNLIWSDGDVVLLESLDDIVSTNRAVEMTFVVGVGFDRDALVSELFGQLGEDRQDVDFESRASEHGAFRPWLVVIGCQGSQTLWNEIVQRVATFDGDDFTLLAEVIDGLISSNSTFE